jgi:NAD(P)-dependent dehydrogenase (short-subunit alcohol dehydrogenase family)
MGRASESTRRKFGANHRIAGLLRFSSPFRRACCARDSFARVEPLDAAARAPYRRMASAAQAPAPVASTRRHGEFMQAVLITGANRGLGLEFAKQYAADGYRVFATTRDRSSAKDLRALADAQTNVTVHALDASRADSVRALAQELAGQPIDILLSNAGVMGPTAQSFGSIDFDGMLETFNVNSIAPLRLAEAFVDQVAKSERKLIVAITSGMGSIHESGGGSYAYRASKAALNMSYRNLAIDLKERGITAVVINPGWVKTDMGGPGAQLEPSASISAMRSVLAGLRLADSGKFLDYKGGTWAW